MSVANGVNIEIQEAAGGVTAAAGFVAGGLHAGLKKCQDKKDLAIIHSLAPAVVGAVFTQNKFAAAPVNWCRQVVAGGRAQAVVVNSGNANACTGAEGAANAAEMAAVCGKALQAPPEQVLVCSTGVIGVQLPMPLLREGIATCAAQLSTQGGQAAAEAIMTTDLYCKETAVSYQYQGKTVTVGGIAKGSGMIHPNMATMLCFITTDLQIEAAALQQAVKEAADASFNMVTVDGDTSTNDSMLVLANGQAGNETVQAGGAGYAEFVQVLTLVAARLARLMAYDGEGATKLLECQVCGAPSLQDARLAAKAVVGSSLVKAAFYGEDANWGRIACAAGYSGAQFDTAKVNLRLQSAAGEIELMRAGSGLVFDEEAAKQILQEREILINLDLGSGEYQATSWGCDLSHEYVNINADYRS
ncbi:MAG: bifunctional glutamate N-acetyltransferase/amino-acid acetyltransferase ArgJ [Peptococcaceae bacterium]|nr:bifunctional glutamate N-acetyltransferase/amino-acid acetyltransferase ArgJ [Peptococcaceae bacterium]